MRSKFSLAALAAVSIFVAGCASKPNRFSKEAIAFDIPERWKVEDDAVAFSEDGWLDRINNMDLANQIQIALENNPNLKITSADVDISGYQFGMKKKDRYPTMQLEASGNRQEATRHHDRATIAKDERSKNSGVKLTAEWEFDIWGRINNETSAAKWRYQSAQETLEYARISLAAQVSNLWFDAVEQESLIELTKKEIGAWKNSKAVLEDNYRAGIGTSSALYLMDSEVDSAEARLQQQIQLRNQSIRQILVLQGKFPDEENMDAISVVFPELDVLSSQEASMDILLNRPDVKSAMLKLKSSDADAMAAYKALMPSLKLSIVPELVAASLTSLNPSYDKVVGTLTLSQPLLSQNHLLLDKKIKQSEQERAYWQYMEVLLSASEEVLTRTKDQQLLTIRQNKLESSRDNAKAAADASGDDYKNGVGDVLNWLELKRTYLALQQQVVQNRATLTRNWIELQRALATPLTEKTEITDNTATERKNSDEKVLTMEASS